MCGWWLVFLVFFSILANLVCVVAADVLANVKFVHEKKLIGSYFDQISLDTGCICFGVADTVKALEMVRVLSRPRLL